MSEKSSKSNTKNIEVEPIREDLLDWLRSKDKVEFIVVPHSHLDHTWYRDRQASEMREAEVMERALMVDKFTLEQMIVAKDFLEGGGKRAKDRFEKMITDGDLELIGQYAQPEVFLSPEENTFWMTDMGRRKARELGGVPTEEALYIPDSFGFPETIPDIMHAQGQKTFQFKRGFDGLDEYGAVFWWEGPSGNKVLAMPLQGGYDNMAGFTNRDIDHSKSPDEVLNQRIEHASLAVRGLINRYGKRFRDVDMPHMILMDGSDFTKPDLDIQAVLDGVTAKMRRDYKIGGATVRLGSLREYSELVRASIDEAKLKTYRGEMRAGREHFVLRGIDSSRMYLKQAMHRAGTRIYDAGVAASLALLARKYPHGGRPALSENEHQTHQLVDSYWEAIRLLQPATQHDGISGCGSSDSYDIHEYAMSSSYSRANQAMRNALAALADRHDPYGPYKYIENTRGAFNSLPFRRSSLVEVPLQDSLEHATALRGFMQLHDGTEQEIPVQITTKQDIRYATYVVKVSGLNSVNVRLEPYDAPARTESIDDGRYNFENETYRVDIAFDGSLSIENKATGAKMSGLVFEEQGDRGDEYNFNPIDSEKPKTTGGSIANIHVIEDGPVFTEIQIDTGINVPISLDGDEADVREVEQRSPNLIHMPISTKVRLVKGIDRIEFTTTVNNVARDHRVRVLFNTPEAASSVLAREPYTLTERSAVPISGGNGWQEPLPIATSHANGLVTAGDLLLMSRGLPEYEATTDVDGNINGLALTLFRGVGYLSRGNLSTRPGWAGPGLATPDAQMQGINTYEYAVSLGKNSSKSSMIREADSYNHPIEDVFHDTLADGILNIDSYTAITSQIYPEADGESVGVRLYNPSSKPTTVWLTGIYQNAECDGKPLPVEEDGSHYLSLKPGISTIRIS